MTSLAPSPQVNADNANQFSPRRLRQRSAELVGRSIAIEQLVLADAGEGVQRHLIAAGCQEIRRLIPYGGRCVPGRAADCVALWDVWEIGKIVQVLLDAVDVWAEKAAGRNDQSAAQLARGVRWMLEQMCQLAEQMEREYLDVGRSSAPAFQAA